MSDKNDDNQNDTTSNSNSNINAQKVKHAKKCDVCGYGDGHNGMVLIECNDCRMAVHRDCYGMPTYTRKTFSCWACQAVGRTFHVHDAQGKPLSIRQTERPTHCSLCGYQNQCQDEVHAMHPVYDNYGNKARQMYYATANKKCLVWAHTLCGFFLSTKKLMYAVSQEGVTHEGDEEDENDDRSVNPELDEDSHFDDEDEDPFGGFAPTHHFVYYLKQKVVTKDKNDDDTGTNKGNIAKYQHTEWSDQIQIHQEELKCEICHQDDSPGVPEVLRIPVQCSAGDVDEFRHYRHLHMDLDLEKSEKCTRSFHVGCARWGAGQDGAGAGGGGAAADGKEETNATQNDDIQNKQSSSSNNHRRVYYYPGLPDTRNKTKITANVINREPIRCLYCPQHAKDVDKDSREDRQITDDIKFEAAKKKRKLAMAQKYGRAATLTNMEPATQDRGNNNNRAKPTSYNVNSKQAVALAKVKQDLAAKVVKISKDKGKAFAKEQKKLWKQRLCSRELGISPEDFQIIWGEAKSYAFDVWQKSQQR